MHPTSKMLAAFAFCAALAAPALASAGERVLLLRTTEDPAYPPAADVCAAAPFSPVNVHLGASVWSYRTRASDGQVVNEEARFLGTATGCGQVTSFVPFSPGQMFLIRFDLEDGTYVASGTCDIVSITVPARGIMLAGCALKLVSAPPGVIGGLATSASVFNPLAVPGYGTGSYWTLHLYTQD